ncbi:MAG: exodeoxyribonuclease V subunit alpha [Candidatus Cloacimonadota bacterium]|nr:MAG: exodeoxyribonuclease V subunit alpha [Candidatus Cloacimonadota bacterium]PIE77654.1 MAG: exodeoxyribonuclease V subunit alpha [Candidatus Delongbacteria bacterium]
MNFTDPHQAFADFFQDKDLRGLAYGLSKRVVEGHLCLEVESYNKDVLEYRKSLKEIEVQSLRYPTTIEEKSVLENSYIYFPQRGGDLNKPFVYDNGKFYLARYWFYEKNILNRAKELLNREFISKDTILKESDFIRDLFNSSEKIINWQLVATISSLLKSFSIITGGPGTGKTTTIAKLLAIVIKIDPTIKIALAAPTGKAATRMNESLNNSINDKNYGLQAPEEIKKAIGNLKAETIHRLLGWKDKTHYFIHDRKDPLNYDLIIVDEASMIDVSLMSKLLDAIPETGKIILLGDKNQLASVEAGSVFGDICRTQGKTTNNLNRDTIEIYNICNGFGDLLPFETSLNFFSGSIVELIVSRRFKDSEGIGKFSKSVILGESSIVDDPEFSKEETEGESVYITEKYNSLSRYYRKYKDYLREPDIDKALEKFDNFRLLTATNDDQFGLHTYNKNVEEYLGLNRGNHPFYHNQPIMITKNNSKLGIYNGDIGIVREYEGRLYLYFSKDKKVSVVHIVDYVTAFAITIHKSQGSEFKEVLIVLPENGSKILSRELLYTAVTRAKKRATIVAKNGILKEAISTGVERSSGIVDV